MRKIFSIVLTTTLLFLTACQTSTEVKKDEHAGHSNKDVMALPTEDFSIEFVSNPAQLKADEQTEMTFTVKNKQGETVKDFQIVHEKPMHLLIVSEDLAEFYHEHPELQANGVFKVPFTFKNGGKFKIYSDFAPKDAKPMVKSLTVEVTGNERPREELKADEKFEKTADDLLVMMKTDGEILSGKDLMLHFQVFEAKTKKPVTDLQNYLGEKAHFIVISQDLREFVHAHPVSGDKSKDGHHHPSEIKHDEKSFGTGVESTVSAHLAFPSSGLYKIFAQFKRNGKIITVPFVVSVKENLESANTKPVEVPKDAYKITVTKDGYTPSEVSISKSKFTKLAFYRAEAEGCGDEVIFKSLGIRRKLPVGEIVLIDLPKDFSGELSFTCGMNMYQGKLIFE